MSVHLVRDLDQLKKELLVMGGLVEESVNLAIQAILEHSAEIARQVMSGDDRIDAKEVELEDECLKILALHQPVAGDLRFVVTALKVNNDLERIGDLAINLAERALSLADLSPLAEGTAELKQLGNSARTMVHQSLDALIRQDVELARTVIQEDDRADKLNREIFTHLRDLMHSTPEAIDPAIYQLSAARQLERIADHATNIAEDVVFLVEGAIIRHQPLASPGG